MKVVAHPEKPKPLPVRETKVGHCYSNEYPVKHLFIRTGGYSARWEESGFVNLATGMFTPIGECCSHWYEVDAEVVIK